MKKHLLLLLLLSGFVAFAQIPSYYNNVNLNLSGTALRDELAAKVIATHTNALSYTPGIWEASKATDLEPGNPSQVLLIYGYSNTDGNYVTDRTRSVNSNGGSAGSDWNREHTFPNSLANPRLNSSGTNGPPYADAHNLRPADVTMNSNRSNKKFASGSGNAGNSGGGWYPGDEWKGDVARIIMYMYLRYGSQCYPTLVTNGTTNSIDSNMIDLLLQWNADDPVSTLEDNRNAYHDSSATYAQGNRNPFIDNPAFATQIWGGPQAQDRFGSSGGGSDTQAPTAPAALAAGTITATSISLSWNASTDNVGVTGYNVYQNGSFIQSVTTTSANVSNLTASTTYSFFVRARDAAGNLSANSNQVSVTTSSPGSGGSGSSSELFFSEYIEGSSNNKALEIANFTGGSINLSGYSLRRNVNGGSSWGSTFSLSGTVANGDVFVIANSNATAAITNEADITTGADALIFNGNDPVGLFKNGTLIDVIGNFAGGSANFAANTTLRRKSSISEPSTTYDANDWDVFPSDTFNNLGSHSIDGASSGGSGSSSELFFSEYIEGSSNNKALEIANFTGGSINLSGYSLRRNVNGGSSWGSSFSLSGTIANEDVFVIANSNATSAITNEADITTGADGNDPVGLFKNGTLIDVIGNFAGGSANFAANTTLRRKSSISEPSTTYNANDWDTFPTDTFGNLGTHSIDGGGSGSGPTSIVLQQSFFETGFDNWIDGGGDCSRYSGMFTYEGSYSIRLRDNSGTASSMTSQAFNLSTFDTVEVTFYFIANSMETGEDFWLQFNDGSGYVIVDSFVSGTDFNNNTFYSATVTLSGQTYNFGASNTFRFRCDASSNADQVYIDEVTITGISNGTSRQFPAKQKGSTLIQQISMLDNLEEIPVVNLFPVPTQATLTFRYANGESANYKVLNLLGQTLLEGQFTDETTINVSQMNPGVYVLYIRDEDEIITRRFVKN